METTAQTHEEHQTSTGLPNTKLAMWAFLGSECLFFGAMISTYLLYRNQAPAGTVKPVDVFDIPYTSVSSFVLLMSSLTMVLGLAAFQRGDEQRGRGWLLATALLGAVFVGGQVFEFTDFYHEGVRLQTNAASTAFFVLTGFHGAHVTGGILMLLSLVSMSKLGKLPASESLKVENVGLYWHFVDVVWIVIFTVVYLMP